ncbi:MAG: hypothetical protein PHI90_07480 [Clostridia bacterium]|nr:hypothetical protein [Clostridia bacterium]MDD4048642.1 hypothetical protein [Clostridia bacterium]
MNEPLEDYHIPERPGGYELYKRKVTSAVSATCDSVRPVLAELIKAGKCVSSGLTPTKHKKGICFKEVTDPYYQATDFATSERMLERELERLRHHPEVDNFNRITTCKMLAELWHKKRIGDLNSETLDLLARTEYELGNPKVASKLRREIAVVEPLRDLGKKLKILPFKTR